MRGRERHLRLRPVDLGLRQRELVRRYDVLVGEELRVPVLDVELLCLRQRLLNLRLVDERHDLEHLLSLRELLSLVDEDARDVTFLEGAQLDVLLGANLGHVLLR